MAEITDDDVAIHRPGFVVFDIGLPGDLPLVEGDRPKPALPIVARLADVELHSEAYTYRILTMDGTASGRPRTSWASTGEIRFREGELAVFDHADPLALTVLPDLVAEEPREYFYLLVYALIEGISWPAFTAIQRVEILDDDYQEGVLDGGATLWVGGAGAGACPSTVHSVVLKEPDPEVAPWIDVAVPLAARLGPLPGETGGVCGLPSGTFEARVSLAPGVDAGASVPHDVTLAARAPDAVVFAPQDHAGAVVLRVYADELLEADETVRLLVSVGVHGVVPVELVVLRLSEGARARHRARRGVRPARPRDGRGGRRRAGGPLLLRALGRMRRPVPGVRPARSRGGGEAVAQYGRGNPAVPRAGQSAARFRLRRSSPSRGRSCSGVSDAQGPGSTRLGGDPARWRALVPGQPEHLVPCPQPRPAHAVDGVAADRAPHQFGLAGGSVPGAHCFAERPRRRGSPPRPGARGSAVRLPDRFVQPPVLGRARRAREGRSWPPCLGQRRQLASGRSLRRDHAPPAGPLLDGLRPLARGSLAPSAGYQPHPELAAGTPSYRLFIGGASLTALRFRHAVLDVDTDAFDAVARLPGGGAAEPRTLGGATRRRVAARLGVPLDVTGMRRLSVGVVRRWDAGPDIAWLSRVGSYMDSYDLVGDVRIAAPRSRLSAAVSGRVQLAGAVRGVAAAGRAHRRETAVSGVLRWGHAETAGGWSIALRPAYGYLGAVGAPRRSLIYSELVPFAAGTGIEARPLVAVDAGYGFGSGARISVSGERGFGRSNGWSRGSSMALRFERAW